MDGATGRWAAGLAAVGAALDDLAEAPTWSLSDAEVRDDLTAATALLARLEAARLRLLQALDTRPDAVAGARAGQGAKTFLLHALNSSRARAHADVAAARALDPDSDPAEGGLPAVGAALAAGEISREHADLAVRNREQLPGGPMRRVAEDGRAGGQVVDEFLAEQCRALPPHALKNVLRQLLATVDPDRAERFDPEAHRRRFLSMNTDATGMVIGRYALPAAQGAVLKAALERLAAPAPAGTAVDADGQGTLVPDARTRNQRLADAAVALARAALEGDGAGQGDVRAEVLVVATAEQLAAAQALAAGRPVPAAFGGDGAADGVAPGLPECLGLGPVSLTTLGLLACHGVLQAVMVSDDGPRARVLDLGRRVRLASRAQRRALAVRDRGCVIPGCDAPAAICDAHHLTFWSHGGGTDLANLVLLCPRHHTEVHLGVWQLQVRDGIPWVVPPDWVDPQRRPLRNTAHDAADQARRLGQRLGHQLRLDLGPGAGRLPDTG